MLLEGSAMKKLLSALLLIVLLAQALPFEALATVGRIMSDDELARAYALTGLGTGGLSANGEGTYHGGMKPNVSWNASQLRDWLDEKLDIDLYNVTDLLSQTAFTLSELKETDPDEFARRMKDHYDEDAQQAYLEAEKLRELLRYYQDQLTEASGVIAEYGRRMKAHGDTLFDSDKVRWSACIEEAEAEIVEIRTIIAENTSQWEQQIDVLEAFLKSDPVSNDGKAGIGTWMADLFTGSGAPVSNTAQVARVSISATRANRLSMAAGVTANDVEAKITVISENEVSITLQTGTKEKPEPVKGIDIWVRDATVKDAQLDKYTTNDTGTVAIPVNKFKMDEYDIVHLYVKADPRPQGFQDFIIEDMDLAKGEPYTLWLTPVKKQSSGGDTANDEGDPYIYMMSFNGKDIMNSEYDMIFSTVNDYEFEIRVGVHNTEGKNLPNLVMRYYGSDGVNSEGKYVYADPTGHEGDVYTFKGKWKQLFAPQPANSKKNQVPVTFMFGRDAAENLTFPSKLVSHKSATDDPIDKGTGIPSIFEGVLGKGFSLGFKIPVIDMNVGLNLPFTRYLPRIIINPGGFVNIFIGSTLVDDELKKTLNLWQSKDARAFTQANAALEKKGAFGNYMGKYNLAKEFYKSEPFKLMGEASIDVGLFVLASGRWELDANVPDVKSVVIKLKSALGVTAAFSYSWTIPFNVGPVPLYVAFTFGVSAGFSINYAVSFCWVNGGFQNWSLTPLEEVTITIGLSLAARAGIGIKGFLDGWVEFSASLNLMIRFSMVSDMPSSATVSGDIKMSLGATVFFVSFRKDFNIISGQIYPNGKANLLQHYMNAAEKPQQGQVTYAEPQSYPQLAKDAKKISMDGERVNADSDFKVVEVGGKRFAFHLAVVKGSDGKEHKRVAWECLNPDQGARFNSTQSIVEDPDMKNAPQDLMNLWIKNLAERDEYAFDVAAGGPFVMLIVTAAKDFDADGYPVRNQLKDQTVYFRLNQNMMAYVLVLESDGKGQLSHRLSFTPSDGHNFYFKANSVSGYSDADEGRVENYVKNSYDSFTNPRIDYCRVIMPENGGKAPYVMEMYGEMPTIAYKNDTARVGATGFYFSREGFKFITDKNVASGMGDGYERTKLLNTLGMSNELHDDAENRGFGMEFVAISQPKNGAQGEKALELYDFEMNLTADVNRRKTSIVLDKGEIDNLVAATMDRKNDSPDKVSRRFFYTKKEKNKDGVEQNRLYGLVIEPTKGRGTDDPEIDVTKYVYDAVIPTSNFNITILNNVTYLYWVSTAPKQKDSDPAVWRVWAMAFDPNSNTVLDPAVLAEFKLPQIEYQSAKLNVAVSNVILLSSGIGYLNAVATNMDAIEESKRPKVAPIALFSYEEKLQVAANLITAVPKALAVRAGDFEDVTLGVMNEGNIAISTFDISMFEVVDGKESDQPVEIVHINALDPSRNRIILSGGTVLREGKDVAYRQEDYGFISRKHDWVVDSEVKAYKLHKNRDNVELRSTDVIKGSAPKHIKVEALMPGSMGSYCAAFRIPESWKGEKTMRLRVTAASVESNVMAAAANAMGLTANGESASVKLDYVLNRKTGKLELQVPPAANAAVKSAVDSGLFANEVDAMTTDMVLNVHDIDIKHRVYDSPDGERLLDITIRNYAATRETLKLSCAVYPDGTSDAVILSLPLYPKSASNRRAQTITLPVSDLVDNPEDHTYARVEISVVDIDENAYANNEFEILLGGGEALSFARQPEDVTVQEGEDVSFEVEVTGGTQPYTYQWQVWDPTHEKWLDLPGFTEPTLRREDIEKKWDGCRFRCVVTDAYGNQIISREVTLTVRDRVPTGDGTSLPLYLAVALAALALLWWLNRRARAA